MCGLEECSDLAWEVIVVDDNSPDGTQEVATQLAATYGDDKIVLKPRAGKLGLGYVRPVLAHLSIAQRRTERRTSMASIFARETL
jgi:glycosyltransferase involved in cell wall biosynthesis